MSPPKGVLLLTHRLDLGGSERQMTEVAKGLDRNRFTPHVACFHPEGIRGEELRAAAVPILHLPVTSFASVSALRGGAALMRYIRHHGIRIVHSYDVPLNIFSVPFAKLAHGPVVLSSQRAHRNLTPGLYTRLLRITDQMIDGIVVNCLHMRDHLTEEERISPELIHLCYNGIDFLVFRREGPKAVLPQPAPEGGAVIGVVCALRPEKGLLTLIRGFASVHRRHPFARLVIVGGGPMLPQLEREAEALGVRRLCSFVHKTSDVAQWMRAIDIFVLPSLSEALSNSLMEAMACGCCCIASRVGGNPELIGENTRGLLFPKEDSEALAQALDKLLQNRQLRQELADAGHRFIHGGFSQAQSVGRMEEIYTSFVGTKQHRTQPVWE